MQNVDDIIYSQGELRERVAALNEKRLLAVTGDFPEVFWIALSMVAAFSFAHITSLEIRITFWVLFCAALFNQIRERVIISSAILIIKNIIKFGLQLV